jgi:hypothetical protein
MREVTFRNDYDKDRSIGIEKTYQDNNQRVDSDIMTFALL